MKIVYQLDSNGYSVGVTEADECPLEPGVYLIPAGCVETPPPVLQEGLRARWTGEAWTVETVPAAEAPPSDAQEAEALATEMRARRTLLLTACDFTQLPDAPGDTAAWAAYRQGLRDITTQAGFPAAINWPAPPT